MSAGTKMAAMSCCRDEQVDRLGVIAHREKELTRIEGCNAKDVSESIVVRNGRGYRVC